MKTTTTQSAASSLISYNLKRIKLHEKATKKQQKHDMLLTFMEQANQPRPKLKARPTKAKPSFLRNLLSIFL